MLPSNGLPAHLGAKEYWPVYAEASRLGCCLGVHGGAHEGLGMDYLTPYAPINGLGHPFGQMVAYPLFLVSHAGVNWSDIARVLAWIVIVPSLFFAYKAALLIFMAKVIFGRWLAGAGRFHADHAACA